MSSDYFKFIRQIGSGDLLPLSEISREHWECSRVNMRPLQFFKEYCRDMKSEEVIFLFRGLVLAEKHFNLSGGSVASTVSVLQILNKVLIPLQTHEQIAWALENRGSNPYTPLGSLRGEYSFRAFGSEVLSPCQRDFLSCFGLEAQARWRAKKAGLDAVRENEMVSK